MQMVPELDTTEFEPQIAHPLRAPVELANNTIAIAELDGLPVMELDADNENHLTELANRMVLGNSFIREDIQGGFF